MTFQLDTSGHIEMERKGGRAWVFTWSDLSLFTQGYIEALFAEHGIALATALNEQWLQQQKDRDWKLHPSWRRGWLTVGFSDLAPETLARIIADCEAMQASPVGHEPFFRGAPENKGPLSDWLRQRGTEREAGSAFWRFRSGDKEAFFNTSPRVILITVLPQVDESARAFPPLTVTLGDDGKVRLND